MISQAFEDQGINNSDVLNAMMAQVGRETGGEYSSKSENLNYSATRMQEVWGKKNISDTDAARLAHNPEALAEAVYGPGSKMGKSSLWMSSPVD